MGEAVARVLTVKGSVTALDAVIPGLVREGFGVIEAANAEEALGRFDAIRPDAVIVDADQGTMSGIDLCRTLRRRSPVPILVLSVWLDEVDLVVALEVGADAYLGPPFRVREIVARLRALLSRTRLAPTVEPDQEVLTGGEVELDMGRHQVLVRGQVVELAPHEFEILELLMANAGRLVTREALIDRVWHGEIGNHRTVDVQVRSLRAKIEPNARRPQLIKTVRGLGYRFERSERR